MFFIIGYLKNFFNLFPPKQKQITTAFPKNTAITCFCHLSQSGRQQNQIANIRLTVQLFLSVFSFYDTVPSLQIPALERGGFRLWLCIDRFLTHCVSIAIVIVVLIIVLAVSGCISSFEISVITTVVTVFVVLVISAVFSCCILCHNNFFVDGTVKIELAVTTAISADLTSVIAAAVSVLVVAVAIEASVLAIAVSVKASVLAIAVAVKATDLAIAVTV